MKGHQWARVLPYVSGLVNQEVLFQVEYLAAENRVLRVHLPDRLQDVRPTPIINASGELVIRPIRLPERKQHLYKTGVTT